MSNGSAGFNLPPSDFGTPPAAPQKRGLPRWLFITIIVVSVLAVLCCGGAIFGMVLSSSVPTSGPEATSQAATSEAQLSADEELIVNGTLLVEEPFDSADAIDITPGDGSTATVEGGVYRATLSENSSRSVYLNEPLTNFASEVECVVLEGGSDGSCGIIYGVNETSDDISNNDEFFFFVSGGSYGVRSVINLVENASSKSHPAIHTDVGQINLLRVVRQGSDVRLYVNDVLVDRREQTELPTGGVGFAVSADDGEALVEVDNFIVWEIE